MMPSVLSTPVPQGSTRAEICFNFNEDTLTVMDLTDKSNPTVVSRTNYTGSTYTHQGWLADVNDMTYILLDDELDELRGNGPAANGRTTTFIFNIADLTRPSTLATTSLLPGPSTTTSTPSTVLPTSPITAVVSA